jgi:hypothetical protein
VGSIIPSRRALRDLLIRDSAIPLDDFADVLID